MRKLSLVITISATVVLILTGFGLFTPVTAAAQTELYKSCEEDKLTAPLKLDAAAATQEPTAAATTEASAPAGNENIVFLSIVGDESQACYLASETFLENNMMGLPSGFNSAVGITQTISGDVALDLTNIANSQIGDLNINISEFKSDNDRRDGFIRQNFLQSNKYPFATLTDAAPVGLPTGPYQDGTTLKFQIKGTLTVHETKRDTTFDAMGTYKDGTLVIKATTDLNMSDFGIEVPNIGGLLKVDDAVRLEVNLVARAADNITPTPAS